MRKLVTAFSGTMVGTGAPGAVFDVPGDETAPELLLLLEEET
jgi:hypothetical protein